MDKEYRQASLLSAEEVDVLLALEGAAFEKKLLEHWSKLAREDCQFESLEDCPSAEYIYAVADELGARARLQGRPDLDTWMQRRAGDYALCREKWEAEVANIFCEV